MVDQASDCDRNIIETVITESTAIRIMVKTSAAPRCFSVFVILVLPSRYCASAIMRAGVDCTCAVPPGMLASSQA